MYRYWDYNLGGGTKEYKVQEVGYGTRAHKRGVVRLVVRLVLESWGDSRCHLGKSYG